MTLTKPGYRPRLIDKDIETGLRVMGAVCIEGPKWSGKTWTAMNHANSMIDLSNPEGNFQNRFTAELNPALVLEGDRPHLVDEWQEVPKIWDAVRSQVDSSTSKGQFLLTGSSTPVRKGILHSGAGRIMTIRIGTMSLYESGDSSGAVSLRELFDGNMEQRATGDVELRNLIYLVVRGGWPGSIGYDASDAALVCRAYLDSYRDEDLFKIDGVRRNMWNARRLIVSLARNESTLASNRKLSEDMRVYGDDSLSDDTVSDYMLLLEKLFLREDQYAFNPGLGSSFKVGKSPKRHLADPSLSAAALGVGVDSLMKDLNTFGFLFEAMCERDLRTYARCMGGTLGHYRDGRGNEIDAVVELRDGRWGAFEIKLGMNQVDAAAEKLLKLDDKMRSDAGARPPEFLCIIVGLSSFAYRREDGVYVVPITALRD